MAAHSASIDPELVVSVITVCFNTGKTIHRTLESVASQSWPHKEHIVVDGASTDDTLAVIAAHKERLTCVVSEPDQGIYDAMNKGLSLATGDIVCFLNAEDVYAHVDVLRTVALKMQRQALHALFGDVEFFRSSAPDRTIRRYRSDRFRPGRIAYGWMPAHQALFLRRQVYEQVGHYRTDYRIAGDFEFIARAFLDTSLRYEHIPEVLVRMQAGGVSTAGIRSKIVLNREVLRACRENGIPTNMLKILFKYFAKLFELRIG